MRLVAGLIAISCVLVPMTAAAQAPLPEYDAVASIGWAGSEYRIDGYDYWRGSLSATAGAGHYWTTHHKTELEAGWLTRGRSETYREVTIDGGRAFAREFHRASDTRLSLAQIYQFGRNDWVHPYVGAGGDVIRRVNVIDRPAQTAYASTPPSGRTVRDLPLAASRERETRMLVRPFVKAGVKMYASERAFFTTELKMGFGRDFDHAVWKLGVGFDF